MDKNIFAIEVAEKLNGEVVETYKGLSISVPTSNGINPIFYVNDFYKNHTVNETIDIINNIIKVKGEATMKYDIMNFEEASKHIIACLVNDNKLNDEIYRTEAGNGFEDLYIIFKLADVIKFNDEVGYCNITTSMIHQWGIDEDDLLYYAMSNVEYKFEPLMNVLAGLMDEEPKNFESPIWIASTANKLGRFGAIAAIVLAPQIRDKFPNGYYAIPSSIHEMLIIPKEEAELLDIDTLVKQVNEDCLEEKDILSNHAYEF